MKEGKTTHFEIDGKPFVMFTGDFPEFTEEIFQAYFYGKYVGEIIAPDIYINEYEWVLSEFARSENPVFIPECRGDVAKALYAYGEYDALGFAPFGFDHATGGGASATTEEFENLGKAYGILTEIQPMLVANYGSDKMRGALITEEHSEVDLEMGDYILTVSSSVRRKAFNCGQGAERVILYSSPAVSESRF